eukprot:805356-Amphidinium_carterae.1
MINNNCYVNLLSLCLLCGGPSAFAPGSVAEPAPEPLDGFLAGMTPPATPQRTFTEAGTRQNHEKLQQIMPEN